MLIFQTHYYSFRVLYLIENETVTFLREIPGKVYMKDAMRAIEHRNAIFLDETQTVCVSM